MLEILQEYIISVLADVIYSYMPKCNVCQCASGVEHKHEEDDDNHDEYLCGHHCLKNAYYNPICSVCDSYAKCVDIQTNLLYCNICSYGKVIIEFRTCCQIDFCNNRACYVSYFLPQIQLNVCDEHKRPSIDIILVRDTRSNVESKIKCYDCNKPIEYMITCSCGIERCMLCSCTFCWILRYQKSITRCPKCYDGDDRVINYRKIYNDLYKCIMPRCDNPVASDKKYKIGPDGSLFCTYHTQYDMVQYSRTIETHKCIFCHAYCNKNNLCEYHDTLAYKSLLFFGKLFK